MKRDRTFYLLNTLVKFDQMVAGHAVYFTTYSLMGVYRLEEGLFCLCPSKPSTLDLNGVEQGQCLHQHTRTHQHKRVPRLTIFMRSLSQNMSTADHQLSVCLSAGNIGLVLLSLIRMARHIPLGLYCCMAKIV